MKWRIAQMLISFAICTNISAQPNMQTVMGMVSDAETFSPLGFATIQLQAGNKKFSAVADSAGKYIIEHVPVGKADIKISVAGYYAESLSGLDITSGKIAVFDIQLKPSSTGLNEVVIKTAANGLNDLAAVSATKINMEEANKYAAGFSDISRIAQSLAGVASGEGDANTLVVRGNNPAGVTWMLEGNEVPNPNHFPAGSYSSGGGISIISTDMLAASDFMTSAWPAEYGNATSAVFDLHLKKGNPARVEHYFKLGTLGLEAGSEGPFKKNSPNTFIVKYRYSTLSLLGKLIPSLNLGTRPPTYQDLVFNMSFKKGSRVSFNFYGIAGLSYSGERAFRDSSLWSSGSDRYDFNEFYSTVVLGFRHQYVFKSNTSFLQSNLSYDYFLFSNSADSLNDQYRAVNTNNLKLQYHTIRFSQKLVMRTDLKNLFQAGYSIAVPLFRLHSDFLNNNGVYELLHDGAGKTMMVQMFVAHRHKFSGRVSINSGIHFTELFLNKKYSIEPRLGIVVQLQNNQTLTAGTGLHSRSEKIDLYFLKVTDSNGVSGLWNKNLGFQKSWHNVLGYQVAYPNGIKLRAEIYYQYLYNIPVSPDSALNISLINGYSVFEPLANKGTGNNYGLELTIEKKYQKQYYWLFTTSVFNSTYTTYYGDIYNTRYDKNCIVNITGGKDFMVGTKKNTIIGINGKALVMGGDRVTPIDLPASLNNGYKSYFPLSAYSKQLPMYYRFDLGLYILQNQKHNSWKLSFDILNISNHHNIISEHYNRETRRIEQGRGLGLIPVVNFKIDFH